jgi:hypothetical protein
MAGVSISTSVRTGPSSATVRESSQAFFVGLAERGPAGTATMVESLYEFEALFGGYLSYSYLHPTVEAFFEEGGTRAWISRVIGTTVSAGSITLVDSTETDAITLNAVGEGEWSSRLSVSVVAGSGAGTRIVKLFLDDKLIYATGAKSTNADLVAAINTNSIASRYVTAVDEDASLVAVVAVDNLTAGADDHSATAITNGTKYIAALANFGASLGAGAVCVPETSAINSDIVIHANATNRIAILHIASGSEAADAEDEAVAIGSADNAEHASLYFPWIYTPTAVAGVSRLIPPDGYVAAKRALAHNQTGPHQPSAGLISVAKFVNGVEMDIDRTASDALDGARVNPIRVISNTVRVYGAHSCSQDISNFNFITAQDTINTVVADATISLEDLVFSTIDARNNLFSGIEGRLTAICERLRRIGALYEAYDSNGKKLDRGYTVKCDASLNPTAQLADGLVKASVGVRVSSVGDKIDVTIVKSNLTTSVV